MYAFISGSTTLLFILLTMTLSITCDPGYFYPGVEQAGCQPCPLGCYCPNGSPLPCKLGYYSTGGTTICTACPKGTYSSNIASSSCAICEDGSYNSLIGQSSCSACSAGTYSNGTSKSSCTKCPAGYYSKEGAYSCTLCSNGYFSSSSGQSSCSRCTAGTYSNGNSKTTCTKCPGGTYSKTGASICTNCTSGYYSNIGSSSCTLCPDGSYNPSKGSDQCLYCPGGTYSSGSAKTACTSCTAGTYSKSNSSECTNCSAGFYSDKKSSTCTWCPNGSYNPTVGQSTCLICPAGKYSSGYSKISCTSCVAGTYSKANSSKCTNCSAGYYSSASAASCTSCKNGYYNPSTGQSTCLACGAGTYSNGTSKISCSNCPAGYYSKTKAGSCTLCPNGYYNKVEKQGSCLACSAGSYSNGSDKLSCSLCSAGTFSAAKASSCTSCVENYYSLKNASTCLLCVSEICFSCVKTNGYCTNCTSGYGLLSNGKCTQCPAGYYSPGVKSSCSKCASLTYSNAGASSCKKCNVLCKTCSSTTGQCTSCYSGSYVSLGKCVSCLAGYYYNGTACISCPITTYSKANSTICTTCNTCLTCNSTTSYCLTCKVGFGLSQNRCKQCSMGYYSKSNVCTKCPVGYYANVVGSSTCKSCATGYFANSTGTINCYKCDELCSTCIKSNGNCNSCYTGYILKDGLCIQCTAGTKANQVTNNCDVCPAGTKSTESYDNCEECENGYYSLTKSTSCNKCSSTCLTCNNTNGKCISCIMGYGLYSNNNCIKCKNGFYSIDSLCQVCPTMTYQTATGSFSCLSCNQTCSSCDNISGKCLTCREGYELTTLGTCTPCNDLYFSLGGISKCTRCDTSCIYCFRESGKCSECVSGFKKVVINSTKNCVPCSLNGNCSTCNEVEEEESRVCIECVDGFYLDNNKCNKCSDIENCEKCSTQSKKCLSCSGALISVGNMCINCVMGTMKSGDKTCSNCFDIIPNCQLCEYNVISPKCLKCFAPYVISNQMCVLGYSKESHFDNTFNKSVFNKNGCVFQVNDECYSCNNNYIKNDGSCIIKDKEECVSYSKSTCENCKNEVISTTGNCEIFSTCKYQSNSKIENVCIQYKDLISYGITDEHCYISNNGFCYSSQQGFYTSMSLNGDSLSCGIAAVCSNYNDTIYNLTCQTGFILNEELTCKKDEKCMTLKGSFCVESLPRYHIENGSCVYNSEFCKIQMKDECILCEDKLLVNGKCNSIENINCKEFNIKCLSCDDDCYKDVDSCKIKNDTFPYCEKVSVVNSSCIQCEEDYFLNEGICFSLKNGSENQSSELQISYLNVLKEEENKEIIIDNDTIVDNCQERSRLGCLRCDDGFYLSHLKCLPCEYPCTFCSNLTYCTKCDDFSYTLKGHCYEVNELLNTCEIMMSTYEGCVQCKEGYYRSLNGKLCEKCDVSCITCSNEGSCLICNESYYRRPNNITKYCNPQDELLNCLNSTTDGCVLCEKGFVLKDNLCEKCSVNCTICDTTFECFECEINNVLVNKQCVYFMSIDNCVSSHNSLCNECSKDYKLSSDGLECIKKINYGVIISVPILSLILLLVITFFIVLIPVIVISKRKERKKKERVCVFKISRSNVLMNDLDNTIQSNKKLLTFNTEEQLIPIDTESRELLCVGNNSKGLLKVQITTKTNCDKYTIRTVPNLVTLKHGYACEFEIFLKPRCTMKLCDDIVIISLNLISGEQHTSSLKINANTEQSTRLDYDELVEEKIIGEGSFGIVYKGMYRGNCVAIKKMKESIESSKLDEFSSEVNMLDKFRCNYIVHFYGAVFIPNKVSMVTEFAQYGSLQDLLKNKSNSEIDMKLRIKFMLDTSQGILYLHSNGILHRDIKPDNFLVYSLDFNDNVNTKLTDFGSARNVNLLLTNMTFTKGIGTPVYMAPEILKQEKYTKSSDIYSFAISMYECFGWEDVFPKSMFPFPWKIAEFVINGRRLEKKPVMSDALYNLITSCWDADKYNRLSINQIVDTLSLLFTCESS
ncbi:protein serine/threonine kinase, putative [Entamoeba invadens IP1]|uniref:Protein serine/threonine kinase, putative n=1 Tax=Entamoeba invadens IP1 TaxID=370355 RepID=A0A0A1U2K6_ENTIV|nr:protein serine/threonine kinase, putative [Entamoeba invadens IP1]ELP86873.1 protein serine/threonine kinase, putative [Entamoeba invadens IP1]|eukprot:XP_004253644.1 protein serine/threonine kinase, putative [Entamoeba invadens IP1]